jgi:uncharacterized membrane protein
MDWIAEKFLNPLCHYYTLEATLVYGLILITIAFGTYKLLEKLKIKIDKRFFIGIIPFIIYGGWTRALRDHNLGVYTGKLFCSPPIYFLIFLIALSVLLFSLFLQKKLKIEYHKTMFSIGILFLLYNLTITSITNINGFVIVLSLAVIWTAVFFGIHYLKPKILSSINAAIISSHLLDASATFTALSFFGYYEQHVLPTFLINIFGPWVMFPLKIIVVWLVLYAIDKYSEDKLFNNYLKIIILILGLALGIRDMLTLSML